MWRPCFMCVECGAEVDPVDSAGNLPNGPCEAVRLGEVEQGCAVTLVRIWEPPASANPGGVWGTPQGEERGQDERALFGALPRSGA